MSYTLVPPSDERLRAVSSDVTFPLDEGMIELLCDMSMLLIDTRAVGLAAPQVGVNLRIIMLNEGYPQHKELRMINPVIVRRGSQIVNTFKEGCLSVPDTYKANDRHEIVTVEYQDLSGVKYQKKLRGLMSICAQHEIDHLDGILISD